MRFAACLGLVGALLQAAAAHGETAALTLFTSGKYAQAEKAGVAQGDAQGYALAARAVLADDMTHVPCLECLRRAEDYARRAIAADSKYPEAHIYLAVALGYESRIIGILAARFRGYATEAKDNLDDALAADPNNAWALAGMGGWNIEVVRGGGAPLARWLYGATVEKGRDYFARAFAASPGNLVIRYQYALALAGYNLDDYRSDVEETLKRAISGTPANAYEVFEQGRARTLLEALKSGDRPAFDRMVRRDQGFP